MKDQSHLQLDSPLEIVLTIFLVLTVCYLAGELGGLLVLRPQMIWPLWPGCAFLVAMLLLSPRRMWPAILVAGLTGFALYDRHEHLPIRPTIMFLVADAAEVSIAAVGVSYVFGGVPRLNSVKSLGKYLLLAVIVAPASVALLAANAIPGHYTVAWRVGFLTEALALLTITPAILSWARIALEQEKKSAWYYVESALMSGGLVILAYGTFIASGSESRPLLLYSLLPFLVWAALRFGIAGTSSSMIIVAFLAIVGAVHGRGPFIGDTPVNNVLSLQLFLLVSATSFMVLAAVVEEHRAAEQHLRESEERFRLVADTAPGLIWMAGKDKLCYFFNKPWLEFTGRSFEDEYGNGWAKGVHPDDVHGRLGVFNQSFNLRKKFAMEYRLRRHDGEYRWVLDVGSPRFNQDGSFAGYIGLAVDVTENKKAADALRASEERLRLAQQVSHIGTFERDLHSGVLTWTAEMEAIYGLPPGAFTQTRRAFEELIHPWDQTRVQELIGAAITSGDPATGEWRVIWPDGSLHWIAGRWRALMDESGKPTRVVGVNMDITERKLTEEKLGEYERAVEGAAEIILVVDREYRYLIANREFLRRHNFTPEGVIGHFVYDFMDKKRFEDIVKPQLEDCFQGRVVRYEMRYTYPKLGERDLLVSYFPIEGPNGIDRAACILQDITERKQAEETLRSMSQKLIDAQEQERTRIARELHDDINQRVALVAVQIAQIQRTSERGSELSEPLNALQRDLIEISSDLESLSHSLHSSKLRYLGAVAAMKSWCQEFGDRQHMEITFRHHVISAVPPEIGLCMFRVLQEALQNAAKYSEAKHVDVNIAEEADKLHLSVRDSGIGFNVESAKQGKGLGLTSIDERVRMVNGTITIQSRPRGGTTIHIEIPLQSEDNSQIAAG
jgi:PAS domain S-box-containing protein